MIGSMNDYTSSCSISSIVIMHLTESYIARQMINICGNQKLEDQEKERNYCSGTIPPIEMPAITDLAKLMMSFI